MKGILGRKVGMTQVFTTDGVQIPVTVIEVTPNVVLQKKTVETDGYEAIQLGIEDTKKTTKAEAGHAKKAGTEPKKFIKEIRGNDMFNYEVGSEVKADIFTAGEIVDVTGTSKGKGYMGAVYRNNQSLQRRTHGASLVRRAVGSLATIGRNNGIINKGRIMAGHEGHLTTTNQGLEVIKVDAENNYMLIKGNVPGPKKGLVIIKQTVKNRPNKAAQKLVDYSAKGEE